MEKSSFVVLLVLALLAIFTSARNVPSGTSNLAGDQHGTVGLDDQKNFVTYGGVGGFAGLGAGGLPFGGVGGLGGVTGGLGGLGGGSSGLGGLGGLGGGSGGLGGGVGGVGGGVGGAGGVGGGSGSGSGSGALPYP